MAAVLYTTFALTNNEVPAETLRAISVNLRNKEVEKIIIVTESNINTICSVNHELNSNKIKYVLI